MLYVLIKMILYLGNEVSHYRIFENVIAIICVDLLDLMCALFNICLDRYVCRPK